MADRRWIAGPVLLVLVAVLVMAAGHRGRLAAGALGGRQVGAVTPAEQAASFTFAPGVAPADRQVVLTAVASARPEARRLIDRIDGLVDLDVVGTEQGTAGVTQSSGSRYRVDLNLGPVYRELGQRGVDRLILHELGHVVDFALVPVSLRAQLDAGIPAGYGCEDGQTGSCANADERFAETFAKWAMGDIGVDLDIGYKVPPPPSLDAWGAPLAALLPSS
jgi:hypothetical protein